MEEPDLAAAFEEVFGKPLTTPPPARHPDTGCLCIPCRQRDDRLEDLAERRAEERYYQ